MADITYRQGMMFDSDDNPMMGNKNMPMSQTINNNVEPEMRTNETKGQTNNPNALINMLGDTEEMNKYINYGAAALSAYNMFSRNESYDKTISNLEDALGELSQAKTTIGGQLTSDLDKINTDLSELNQLSAVSMLQQNKSEFQKLSDASTDFGMGQISKVKDDLLSNINQRLKTTFDTQKSKADEMIDRSISTARSATNRVSASMEQIKNEIKQVEDAKKNQLRNTVTDIAALASTFYDPTGTTGSVIKSTKFKNKYS